MAERSGAPTEVGAEAAGICGAAAGTAAAAELGVK